MSVLGPGLDPRSTRTRGLQKLGGGSGSCAQQVQGLEAAAAAAPHAPAGCRHRGAGSTFCQQLSGVALYMANDLSCDSTLTANTQPFAKHSLRQHSRDCTCALCPER